MKSDAQRTCRNAYNNYVNDLVSTIDPEFPDRNRSKKLGALVKKKRCDTSGVAPLKDGAFLQSDPKSKANILNRQFSSAFSVDKGDPVPDLGSSNIPSMDNIEVSVNGVTKLLKNLKTHTAPGPDGIPTTLLKETAVEIAPAVALLFQASINQGKVPAAWKKALVVPLFKKGSRSEASNYRPISLTSVICKLCEHVIHCAIIRHLDRHNILSDAQHGFRKRRSCESQLITTINDLAKGLEDTTQIDVILLDYEKAFDKVSHRHLLEKLRHNGVHGNILEWVSSFLHSRTQSVLVDGQTSSESDVTSGVPQGSVLGPLLFLVYINDLPACVTSSTTRLFADDSVMYRRIKSPDDSAKLQDDLNNAQVWEKDWLMSFNASKCQVLQITNKPDPIPASYSIHGQKLEVVSSAKYLGVTLDTKLNFNRHIDAISKKANGTRAFFSRNLPHSNRKIKEAVYTTFIRPTTEYASTAWDPHTEKNCKKLEQVQRGAARYVMGDYSYRSSVTPMLHQLGWSTLEERRLHSRLAMFYKIYFNLIDIPWNQFLTPRTSSTCTRGHDSRFIVPFAGNSVYANSFFPRTVRDWNRLSDDPASYTSIDSFKASLVDVHPKK